MSIILRNLFASDIKIWQSKSPYECIFSLADREEYLFNINSLAILANSSILVSDSQNTFINTLQSETPFEFLDHLEDNIDQRVKTLAILPNSNIVSGGSYGNIKIWQSKSPYV